MSVQRRCSGCNIIGHNIRTCIKIVDDTILTEYDRRALVDIPTTFPERLIPNTNHINKLCIKYGLAITNGITNIQKLERLHHIYLHLGRQRRLNQINVSFQQLRERIHRRRPSGIYRPSYLAPISPEVILEQQNQVLYDINNLSVIASQMLQLRGLDQDISRNTKKPSIQIILDKSKFATNDVDMGECPICYENCSNLVSTECNHLFCQSCFSKLINTINKCTLPCPLCRENVKHVFVLSESSSDMMLNL